MIRHAVCSLPLVAFAITGSRADETRAKAFADAVFVKPMRAGDMRFGGQMLNVRPPDQSADLSLSAVFEARPAPYAGAGVLFVLDDEPSKIPAFTLRIDAVRADDSIFSREERFDLRARPWKGSREVGRILRGPSGTLSYPFYYVEIPFPPEAADTLDTAKKVTFTLGDKRSAVNLFGWKPLVRSSLSPLGYTPPEQIAEPAADTAVSANGFTLRLKVDLTDAAGGETLYEVPGALKVALRDLAADPAHGYDDASGNYRNFPLENGQRIVLEAVMPGPTGRVGIPLGTLENLAGVKDVVIACDNVKYSLLVDGHLDQDFPIADPFWPKGVPAATPSRRVKDAVFTSPAVPEAVPRDSAPRAITRPIQYWTPRGHNQWVGDVVLGNFRGALHVFYLVDRRHHNSKAGRGGHWFEHLASSNLVDWTELPAAVPMEARWEYIGTGTPIEENGRCILAYGLHTKRHAPMEETSEPEQAAYLKAHGEEGVFEMVKMEGLPMGGTYAVSTDGVHFVKSGLLFTSDQNPSLYRRTDGKIGLGRSNSLWYSDRLGGWKPWDRTMPTWGDCPCPFEWNGRHYVIQGFYTMASSPSGKPGTYVDCVRRGEDIYEGMSVPMVAPWQDGRMLYVGWINHLYGWGGWLCFRELVAEPDGRLGTKWVPEIPPPVEPVVFEEMAHETLSVRFEPASKNAEAFEFRVDAAAARAQFSRYAPDRAVFRIPTLAELAEAAAPGAGAFRLGRTFRPDDAGDFAIGRILGLDTPYRVRLVQFYDAKADATLIDVEIAGRRTMVTRRPGRYALARSAGKPAAQRYPVEPFRLYRAAAPCDIQFYDRDGRALHFGAYPKSVLATSPATAAYANVPLEEPRIVHPGLLIPDAAFWQEQSLVEANCGSNLVIRPGGYTVSIPVPAKYDLRHDVDPSAPDAKEVTTKPCRIWYDADMNEMAINFLPQGCAMPSNACFVRFLTSYSRHNNALRLIPAQDSFLPKNPVWRDYTPEEAHPGEIVLAADCDLRERYAATSFRRKVKEVTGRRLPITAAPTENARFHIYIGPRWANGVVKFDSDFRKLNGTDGYCVARMGRDIHAFGAHPRGTIYATVKLLEQVSDYVWWRPNRTCGVSFTPREELDFSHVKHACSIPAFPYRSFTHGGNPCQPDYDDWALHNFITRGYRVGRHWDAFRYHAKQHGFFCHIGASFLDLPLSVEKRDDFYPMVNGKRQVGTRAGQPCFSNPDVVKATLAGVDRILDNAPEEWAYFMYDYSDSWICCECPDCLKPIKLPDGTEQVCKDMVAQRDPFFRSTRTYMMGNLVAKRVRERHPGKKTEMLAYIYTAPLPAVPLDKDIRVLFATYDTTSMRFDTLSQTNSVLYAPESWATRFRGWLTHAPQAIGMYEYFFTAAPAMFAEAAALNLREMAKVNGFHVHSQTQWDGTSKSSESFGRDEQMWDVNAMDQWIIARLMWDPFQSVDDLRTEFLTRVYGAPAAAPMAEWYRLFSKRWFDRAYIAWMNCHTPCPQVYVNFIQKAGIEKEMYRLFGDALSLTTSPAARLHLEKKLQTLKDMKAATGRDDVPFVPEMASEWRDAGSPQWNRAWTVADFRDALPDCSRPYNLTNDLARTPPEQSRVQTSVDLACDARYLYYRVRPDAAGGYVELRFLNGREHRLFFDGTNGTASGRIPMQAIRSSPTNDLVYVFRRFDAQGNVSFGRAPSNVTRAFPGVSSRSFSTLVPETVSRFDETDRSEAGLKTRPPLLFPPDEELSDHPLLKVFSGRGTDTGMRRVRGVPVYDTGYGGGFTKGETAAAGDAFTVTGDRWRYGRFAPVVAWFYDRDGKKIRDTGMPWEASLRDGPFTFAFTCPDRTARFDIIVYDSYLKWFEVSKDKDTVAP